MYLPGRLLARVEIRSVLVERELGHLKLDFCFTLFVGVPFPKNYQQIVKKILTRLFRVFVHVYIHHFDKLVALGAVSISATVL